MFKKGAGLFFEFEKCEPIRLKFQVDYFDKATIFDSNPENRTLDYIEYCKESGWNHIFSSGKMQVFYSELDNPVPIQTDESTKLKFIAKSTMATNWSTWIFIPLIFGIMIGIKNMNPQNYLSYSNSLTKEAYLTIFFLALILLCIVNLVRFGFFYFKNSKRVKNGLSIHYNSVQNTKRFGIFHQLYLVAMSVLFILMSIKNISFGYITYCCRYHFTGSFIYEIYQ